MSEDQDNKADRKSPEIPDCKLCHGYLAPHERATRICTDCMFRPKHTHISVGMPKYGRTR